MVDQDYRGEVVNHACAGIILNDKALLIDLTYGWFGVPHKVFEFKDDSCVLAFYLAHSGDPIKEDIALKACSDWAVLDFAVAAARMKRSDKLGAREALELGLEQDSSSWRAFLTTALIESADSKDWDKVTANLKKCLQVYPEAPGVHYLLGAALAAQGDLVQARDAFRMYLEGRRSP